MKVFNAFLVLCTVAGCTTPRWSVRDPILLQLPDRALRVAVFAFYDAHGRWPSSVEEFPPSVIRPLRLHQYRMLDLQTEPDGNLRISYELADGDRKGWVSLVPPARGTATTAASMPTPAWEMHAPPDPPLATKIVQFDYEAQTVTTVTAADVTAAIGEPHQVIESAGEVRHAYFVKRNIDPPDWVYVLVYDKEGRLKRGEYSPRTTYRLDDQRRVFESATRPSGP